MIQLIRPNTHIAFSSFFSKCFPVSGILFVISLYLFLSQTNYGVDFRGGAEVQLTMPSGIGMKDVRQLLKDNQIEGASVQSFGEEGENHYLIKVPANESNLNEVTQRIENALRKGFPEARLDKVDIVGPKAGAQLRLSGLEAMLWALIAIMVYIGLRFDFKYSPGAIVALFHDVVLILGIFALAQIEFTLQIVAALLAIIGYSVNDTVVIYDRVREHERRFPERSLSEHIDNAASETLSRTLLTSGTTLFVSLVMFFMGGESIRNFFFAISLGVLIGTYSSIFVAAPVTLFVDRRKKKA